MPWSTRDRPEQGALSSANKSAQPSSRPRWHCAGRREGLIIWTQEKAQQLCLITLTKETCPPEYPLPQTKGEEAIIVLPSSRRNNVVLRVNCCGMIHHLHALHAVHAVQSRDISSTAALFLMLWRVSTNKLFSRQVDPYQTAWCHLFFPQQFLVSTYACENTQVDVDTNHYGISRHEQQGFMMLYD